MLPAMRNKDPSGGTASHVQGHSHPLSSVEVRVDGTWVAAERTSYNYWQPPGGDMGDRIVRVTAMRGYTVEAELPLFSAGVDAAQFPSCS